MYSSGLSELVLVVQDAERSAAFYRDVVGLTEDDSATNGGDWFWFWSGEPERSARLAVHRGALLYEEHSPFPLGQRFGPGHFAFRVDIGQLSSAVDHVKSHGIEVLGPMEHTWMGGISYYFYDLDGNMLEWWSPNP